MSVSKSKYKLLREQIRKCIQCGSCRVNCPTATEAGWLSASARSKVMYARDILYARPWARPKITEEFSKRVFECTMCGRCGVECITDISFPDVWIDLREMCMDSGVKIDVVEMVGKTIIEKKNVADQPNEERNAWLKKARLDSDPSTVEKADVVLFVGCMGAYYPQSQPMVRSFAQVMEAAGIKFAIMGEEEYCCGFPLLSAGKVTDAVELMRHNMDVVKKYGAKLMVTTCPACMKTWRDEYAHYLHEEIPFEVKHATEYVEEILKSGKVKLEEAKKDQTVTYHDGCDLGRNAGVYDAPRNVIKMIPGLTFVEHPESREKSNCCGAGGDMLMTNADMAESIGQKRAASLAEYAEVVMTACPACKKQLKDTAKRAGVTLKSQDIIELVAKQLPKKEKPEKTEKPAE